MANQITIEISEGIRVAPYEIIKPMISMTYDVPEDVDLEDFYKEKYREVKRIWNKHLFNQLYNSKVRLEDEDVWAYAHKMVSGKEKFPVFKPKTKKEK